MYAHPLPIHKPFDGNDLIDEEFDSFDVKRPFNRKPVREQTILLCDGRTWDDPFDTSDILCELEA